MTARPTLPALDPMKVEERTGTAYPPPHDAHVKARRKRALGDAAGLTHYGVNLVELPPGCWSSQRHWHAKEDEFVYVLEGELVLVTDNGEQVLGPGMAAGFPAGKAEGHKLENRSAAPVRYLEIGDRSPTEEVTYTDSDMHLVRDASGRHLTHKDGTPY
jgi:uncharacterized cupin superfamily protein